MITCCRCIRDLAACRELTALQEAKVVTLSKELHSTQTRLQDQVSQQQHSAAAQLAEAAEERSKEQDIYQTEQGRLQSELRQLRSENQASKEVRRHNSIQNCQVGCVVVRFLRCILIKEMTCAT